MQIRGQITWNFDKFEEKIYKELRRYFRSNEVKLKVAFFNEFLKELIKESIEKSDAWLSLQNYHEWYKSLASHFGLEPETIDYRLNTILNIWMQEVHTKLVISPSNKDFHLTLHINAIDQSYKNVLGSDVAWYISESGIRDVGARASYRIDWLKWLLVEGDSVKISGYRISPTTLKSESRSRSGLSLMVRGGRWKMPYPYDFPERNNFLTRMFESEYFTSRLYKMIDNLLRVL